MTPKRGTGGNLLVPVALSASAVAYSSTRIESMFMYVGTAAGVAAKQVVDGTAPTVQEVNVSKVQDLLQNEFHQIIHIPPPPSPTPPPVPPAQAPAYYNVSGGVDAAVTELAWPWCEARFVIFGDEVANIGKIDYLYFQAGETMVFAKFDMLKQYWCEVRQLNRFRGLRSTL